MSVGVAAVVGVVVAVGAVVAVVGFGLSRVAAAHWEGSANNALAAVAVIVTVACCAGVALTKLVAAALVDCV